MELFPEQWLLHFVQGTYIFRSQCTHVVVQSEGERRIAEKIQSKLNVSKIEVEDISGIFFVLYIMKNKPLKTRLKLTPHACRYTSLWRPVT